METLRKLRDRAKYKSKSQFEPYVDPDSNQTTSSTRRPSTSVWSRHGSLLSRHKSRTVSIESSVKAPNEFQKFSGVGDANRPETSGRMQPKLVAISRPSLAESRPDTAASIQEAVDKAADSAAQTRSKTPKSNTSKVPRYIDIFAISSQASRTSQDFNEEVASRNLDSPDVGNDDASHHYRPSSRYQEEVASRNLNSPDSTDEQYKITHARIPSRDSSYSQRDRHNQEHGNTRQSQDTSAYHSRQYAARMRTPTEQLPAIPQERSSSDGGSVKEFASVRARQIAKDIPIDFVERQRNRGTTMPSNLETKAIEARNQAVVPQLLSTEEYVEAYRKTGRAGSAGGPSEPLPDYQLSLNELQRRGRGSATQSRTGDRSADRAASRIESLRPPSNMSTASSIRRSINLPNRTIMDLTGDDSEVFSIYSTDYPDTPIIQSATSDTYQKLKPSIVDATGRSSNVPKNIQIVGNATPDIVNWPPTPTDNMRLDDDDESFSVRPESVTQGHQRRRSATPPSSNFAFSRISTLASTSPRTSNFQFDGIEMDENGEPVQRRRSLDEAIARGLTQPALLKAIKEDQVLSTGNTPTASPEVRADQKISPMPSPSELTATANPMDMAGVLAATSSGQNPKDQTSDKQVPSFTEQTSNKATLPSRDETSKDQTLKEDNSTTKDLLELPVAQPVSSQIVKSPEGLQSTDFTNPTEAFGVKSRDFAFASNDQPVQKQATPTPEPKAPSQIALDKSKKAQDTNLTKSQEQKRVRQNSSAPRKSRPISVWDEEGFQRKQAEAKAALLRLQQSLNEELPPLEAPASTKRDEFYSDEDFGTSDGGQAAPSSAFANERKYTARSISASQVPTTYNQVVTDARDQPRPEIGPRNPNRPSPKVLQNEITSHSYSDSRDFRPGRSSHRQAGQSSANAKANSMIPALARVDADGKAPESPGEVSLSSFPLPISRDMSPDAHKRSQSNTSAFAINLVRRGSQASRMSSASAYSIPFHMVPGRGSSLRDRIVVEQGRIDWE